MPVVSFSGSMSFLKSWFSMLPFLRITVIITNEAWTFEKVQAAKHLKIRSITAKRFPACVCSTASSLPCLFYLRFCNTTIPTRTSGSQSIYTLLFFVTPL
jgi:hypothetical protein